MGLRLQTPKQGPPREPNKGTLHRTPPAHGGINPRISTSNPAAPTLESSTAHGDGRRRGGWRLGILPSHTPNQGQPSIRRKEGDLEAGLGRPK